MAWRTRRSTRSSYGGSSTYHAGSLEPAEPKEEAVQPGDAITGKTRLRTSAKEQELLAARQAGASNDQIRALIDTLQHLAAALEPEQLLDWSVRFETRERVLCLRWRMRTPGSALESPPAWQTRRFGGKSGPKSGEQRPSSQRGFG